MRGPAILGELAVASHPRMRAVPMVSGKKILELPSTSWSKKFLRAGAEVGNVEDPAGERDGQAEFVLLVALTVQRQEAETSEQPDRVPGRSP